MKQTLRSLCAVALFAAVPAGCGPVNLTGDGGLIDCNASFGTTDAARKLRAVLDAANAVIAQANALDTTLLASCTAVATDLGATPAELAATGSMTATQVACTRAAQLVTQELAAVRAAGASVTAAIDVTPPLCRVDVDAYGQCAAQCTATYTPGMAQLQCTGGELRGGCSGSCTGSCAVAVSGSCTGQCEGSCSGSCTGTCVGQCDGTCSQRDAHTGSCVGSCTGTCTGTCSAGCTGSCMGQCVAQASGSCMAECRGACSVQFTQPRCTGQVTPPMIDADCQAACTARVNATVQCTPASASLRVSGDTGTLAMRAMRLQSTLAGNYGSVVTIAAQFAELVSAGVQLVQTANGLPSALRQTLGAATVCAVDAATRLSDAVNKVQINVQVTVTVTASVQ